MKEERKGKGRKSGIVRDKGREERERTEEGRKKERKEKDQRKGGRREEETRVDTSIITGNIERYVIVFSTFKIIVKIKAVAMLNELKESWVARLSALGEIQ